MIKEKLPAEESVEEPTPEEIEKIDEKIKEKVEEEPTPEERKEAVSYTHLTLPTTPYV